MESIEKGVCSLVHKHERDTNTAVAVCVKHAIFLCTSCLIENSHRESDCKIIALNENKTELEKLQVDVYRLRQGVTSSIDKCEDAIAKNEEKLNDTKEKVEDFRNKLVQTIDDKKDKIFSEMQSHHEEENKNIKVEKTKFQSIISSLDDALTDDAKEDTDFLRQVLEKNLSIFVNLPKPSELHEHRFEFYASNVFEKKITEENFASCVCNQIYDDVDPPPTPPRRNSRQNPNVSLESKDETGSKDYGVSPPTPPRRNSQQNPDVSLESQDDTGSEDYGDYKKSKELQKKNTESKADKTTPQIKPKQGKPDGKRDDTKPSLLKKIFNRKQPKSKDGKVQQKVENKTKKDSSKNETPTEDGSQANEEKSTNMSGIAKPVLESYFTIKCHEDEASPCCFQSVRQIGEGNFIILDTEHQSLLLVDYKGSVHCDKKLPENIKHITAVNGEKIVAVSHDASNVVTFQIKKTEMLVSSRNKIDVDGEVVISFDFDKESHTFSLITRRNVVILDSKMTELKRHRLGDIIAPTRQDDEQNVVKTFHVFYKDEIILFDSSNKSIKFYSLEQETFVHKIRCDTEFREVVGFDDFILICCDHVILELSKNGEFTGKNDIEGNIEGGCRSVCVDIFERVMLLTSLSKDKAKANRVYVTSFDTTEDTSM